MRNLKRVLSLGMTAAMITGLMVVGTSAASYADVSTEDNVEAISVLEEVGIMVGDENGDFNPDQLVTRNEMAVVMSNLMDYRVATYAGTSPFTDVPSWAEPYVAACWTNGITAGTSATTYGGDASVTTAQAALMLMKALGYFQYSNDFGSDWQLATVSQGSKIGLFKDVEAAVSEAMTRNDVAQMVLNTLESGMVEASSGSSITVGDIVINNNVEYNYVTSSENFAKAISTETPASSTSGTAGAIVELGEKLYDGDLKKYDNAQDDFGRPGTQWRYKTTDIGTFADNTVEVYTAKASKGDLYTLLGSSMVNDLKDGSFDLDVYYNGERQGKGTNSDKETVYNPSVDDYFDRNNSAAAGISGKGVVTEVYVDDDHDVVTLVFINTYAMQATADYDKDKGDLNVTVLTGPATVNALQDDEFDVADYMEDDYIIYTYAKGDVQTVEPAKVVSGEVTAYSVENYVTLDGTKYEYAAKIDGNADDNNDVAVDSAATTYVVGDNASIVLDPYGYVIYVDDASISVGNYVYIDAIATSSGLSSNVKGDAYFSDGTNEEITIKKMTDADGDELSAFDKAGPTATKIQAWFSYTIDSNDKYSLKQAKTTDTASVDKIQNGKTNIGGTVAGNSDTIFLVEDKNNDITVYTGISNVPDITPKAENGKIFISYMQSKDNGEKAASLVYVDASNANVKDSTKDSLLYLLKLDETKVDSADGEDVYVWTAIVDGKVTTVETKENTWSVGDFYESYSVDSDGYYEAGDDFDGNSSKTDDKAEYSLNSLSYSSGTLTINGSTYVTLSDTQIVLVMAPKGSSDLTDIMKDADADYEVRTPSGSALANLFKNYELEGKAYVTYADDVTDTDLATVLYVVVTSATEVKN